jgi:hypothetical protein
MNRALGLLLIFLFALSTPALAQIQTGSVSLIAIDTDTFPDMRVYVAVNDGEGKHLAGLLTSAFTLTENNLPMTRLKVTEQEIGSQIVVVLDTSNAFKARDANAVTRLDFIKQALTDFAVENPWMRDGLDDVTVLAPEGTLVLHSSASREVAEAIHDYTTDYAGAANLFPLVTRAIDLASDATPRPGMRRSVIFISNGFVGSDSRASIPDLATRAQASRIPIHTMFIGPLGAAGTLEAKSLQQLADSTGGQAFVFENPESFTPLFQKLADQRPQYLLSYRSALAVTGQHTLVVSVTLPNSSIVKSEASTFPLRVEAPTVSLPDLPSQISSSAASANSEPASYEVPFTVAFPDGHPRRVQEAQLWVDGALAASASPPETSVTSLDWPLAAYTESGEHSVRIRITDELGLTAESNLETVTVSVTAPAAITASAQNVPKLNLIGPGLLLAAGLAVAGGVWLIYARRSQPEAAKPTSLPATQPLIPKPPKKVRPPEATPRLALPNFSSAKQTAQPKALGKAYLEVLNPGGGGASREAIELLNETVRLGREPAQVQIVFPDRSVSRLHARIAEVSPGVFYLYDEGSTSGTWVNYVQIPILGYELKPGDVINLGRVQLRFQQRDGASSPPPTGAQP